MTHLVLGVTMPIVYILSMPICVSLKTSFTNISHSNSLILIKFTQLFQQVI